FLGYSVTQRKNISDATAKVIDEEIRRLVEEGEATARKVLNEHLDDLHLLAKGLLEYETLSADEVQALLRGERIRTNVGNDGPTPNRPPRSSVPTSGGSAKTDIGKAGPGGLQPEPQPGA